MGAGHYCSPSALAKAAASERASNELSAAKTLGLCNFIFARELTGYLLEILDPRQVKGNQNAPEHQSGAPFELALAASCKI